MKNCVEEESKNHEATVDCIEDCTGKDKDLK